MAQTELETNSIETESGIADVVTAPPIIHASSTVDAIRLPAPDPLQSYAERVGWALGRARRQADKTYAELRSRAIEGYSCARQKTQDVARRTQNQAKFLREERPLQMLTIVAGCAFAAGCALRIWRSHAS